MKQTNKSLITDKTEVETEEAGGWSVVRTTPDVEVGRVGYSSPSRPRWRRRKQVGGWVVGGGWSVVRTTTPDVEVGRAVPRHGQDRGGDGGSRWVVVGNYS